MTKISADCREAVGVWLFANLALSSLPCPQAGSRRCPRRSPSNRMIRPHSSRSCLSPPSQSSLTQSPSTQILLILIQTSQSLTSRRPHPSRLRSSLRPQNCQCLTRQSLSCCCRCLCYHCRKCSQSRSRTCRCHLRRSYRVLDS